MDAKEIYDDILEKESLPLTFLRILCKRELRKKAIFCIASIFKNFFFKQSHAAFFKGNIPVTSVDHIMDKKIPFIPGRVNIYLDFVAFWVRSLGFLLRRFGSRAQESVGDFIDSMGELYSYAAEVYGENLSTTERPFHISTPRFLLIHLVDPHLMCVPSLHVMVVIFTYIRFREIIRDLGEENSCLKQAEELYIGALKITEAILYIKQHSVNCIPAALYAMSRFFPSSFSDNEAEKFISGIFIDSKKPVKEDREEIHKHILNLYNRFVSEGKIDKEDWKKPILNFLKNPGLFSKG